MACHSPLAAGPMLKVLRDLGNLVNLCGFSVLGQNVTSSYSFGHQPKLPTCFHDASPNQIWHEITQNSTSVFKCTMHNAGEITAEKWIKMVGEG
jgi:hypothetical protein